MRSCSGLAAVSLRGIFTGKHYTAFHYKGRCHRLTAINYLSFFYLQMFSDSELLPVAFALDRSMTICIILHP
jgi:hypothetical protein